MENQQTNSSLFGLQLNTVSKNSLITIAQWATIIAVVSTVSSVISLIEAITARPKVVNIEGFSYDVEQSTGGNMVGAVIGLIIVFLINYFLYMFGKKTKKAIENIDQGDLNSGFSNLKAYFQITGILLIIVLVFFLIALMGMASMT